jgi:superfamily II DNA or RNA helicase
MRDISGDSASPVETAIQTRLEQLVPGSRVSGIAGAAPVDVVSVKWFGANFVEVTYKHDHGQTGQAVVGRDHEARIRLEQRSRSHAFDGDPESWRLAAEALRIRYAALFDPMLAVASSDLDPLPHQIKAVYEELLPRTPLRFLLADDPGAGKTIMAGLYIKELMLRGDLQRCLVVAPGSLVDQWQEELYDKFGLRYELLTRSMVESALETNVFDQYPLLIARMDQLSRSEDLLERLGSSDWDLVVVDEAHRMSAHYYGAELKTTKRYELGRLLGRITRHLLLMTATPHAGKQEDFQLFLALLDGDRFEGRYRDGVHTVDPGDLMRRMIKEELLTMDGRPLFPERLAYTVPYRLSAGEQELYETVTQYVREEMNRAERLEKGRGNTVGFALTVLQRRLASSPEAILRSLERRRRRLERRRREIAFGAVLTEDQPLRGRLDQLLGRTSEDHIDDRLDELDGNELEELEEDVVDAATAARTIAELDVEIGVLADLEQLAHRVRHSGADRKWSELRTLLADNALTRDASGNLRKIIIFTEHRDTLNYLVEQIGTLLGRSESVVAIHGGVGREQRRTMRELFAQDPDVRVLVATDAAGEGLNLQRAHLMVNYDLPWNPNKIEQRFGRIHRIGQDQVCHLWNLVADGTREGEVFLRLLDKIEEQRQAYAGKVFDVLGDAFADQPLRTLLLDAIRYGDRPDVRAKLQTVIDAQVGDGLAELIAERALHHDVLAAADLEHIRRRLEEAQARRLQPHYVEAFFLAAFTRLGGRISPREAGRYEITHVPGDVRDRDRLIGIGAPVITRYERVAFDRARVRVDGAPRADLLAPGHPLLDAVVDLTVQRHRSTLKHGTVLIDRDELGETPRLLVALTQAITDGHQPPRTVSKRFEFTELAPDGVARAAGLAPYLDYEPPQPDEVAAINTLVEQPWLAAGFEDVAIGWAIEHTLAEHVQEVEQRVGPAVARTRTQVRQRLTAEINYWDTRHAALLDQAAAGRELRISPATAERRAREMERRLERRESDLDADAQLTPLPPSVDGGALVVPQGLVDRLLGRRSEPVAAYARDTAHIERRAVDAVLAAERALGREPREMPHNNPGFDVRSETPDRRVIRIEVKGRIAGADDFAITRNEVLTGKNLGDDYRLALVSVHPDGATGDQICYVTRPFDATNTDDFRVTRFTLSWAKTWSQGGPPR